MKEIAVLKFGGTSVKNVARLRHVAEIIANTEAQKKLVIVSAMGNTTDHLAALARECSTTPDKRELDLLLATGEQVSNVLLTLTLNSLGINARSFTGAQLGIYTDDIHGDANVRHIDPIRLHQALAKCDVAVIAGFQGLSPQGEITTLGRGGSDTTAVAVAAACGIDACDIYTDVNGIYSDDPNNKPDAEFLGELSYDRALALSEAGAQVIHAKAVELAGAQGIGSRAQHVQPSQLRITDLGGAPLRGPSVRVNNRQNKTEFGGLMIPAGESQLLMVAASESPLVNEPTNLP